MKKSKKLMFYRIVLIILILSALIFAGIIFHKQYKDVIYHNENKQIVDQFYKQEQEKNGINLEYKGYKVIGIIQIPKINLEYPILEKTTQTTMNISISRFAGGELNEIGNVSLAGHNNYNGTMFGKNKKLKTLDKFYLIDLNNRKIEYEIYDIFLTDPNDISILETKDETTREVTLITCENGRSSRLIIKAKEVK